ncbi:helix-turn-helix domain-containing protein [Enterococcus sp. JNUCC 77]
MNRIKQLREERGLSLKELQDALLTEKGVKIGRASLNNYEREEQTPKQETWETLADFFNVTVPFIMGFSPARNKVENMFFEQKIGNLVDLVEKNGATTPILRRNISYFSSFLERNKDNQEALEFFNNILQALITLSSKDADVFVFGDNGDYLSNPQIIKKLLKQKKEIDDSVDYFINIALDDIPKYSQITIDPRELFGDDVKISDFLNDIDDNYSYEDFYKDTKKQKEFNENFQKKINENFKKIKRDRNDDV